MCECLCVSVYVQTCLLVWSEGSYDRMHLLRVVIDNPLSFQLTKEGASKAKSLNIPFGDNGTISAADLKHLRSNLQAQGR